MNKNLNKANQERFAAMRLAEINATDKEDLLNCASDMEKTASLNTNEAVVVAKAIRAKYLPNIARQAGLDVSNLDLDHGKETVDFANDESDDEEDDMEFHHFESDDDSKDVDDDDMSDEDMDDEDEVEDSDGVATFEIEVPADMVDRAQKAVQEALDNLLGGDDDSDEDDDEDITHFNDDDDMDSEYESDDDEDNETQFIKKSNEVRSMTKQALAERKAQREALLRRAEREEILMKIASEEETYPASASFKYNEDMVDMSGQVEYPSMTMQGSEGNSLKEQNPTWADQKVPTMNPGSLQFPSVTTPGKFEGTGDGSLEYTVDWDHLETPSEGLEDADQPQIPTQMSSMPHKATRSVAAAREEDAKHDCECTSCGESMRLSDSEMNDKATRCSNKDCPSNMKEGGMDHKKDMDKESATELTGVEKTELTGELPGGQKVNAPVQTQLRTTFQNNSLDLARIKTSYSCATKLALAGIITSEEVDSYAEQMINDGLKSDSMIRQTKLLLKSAQSSTERVVAAAAERMSTRTASTLGVSTSPALSGGLSNNSAALDIQGALKGTWTMPKIED
jgi:hypothetical protein